MNRLLKLCFLIIISLSVFFIYKDTKNSSYRVTILGDRESLGINSYGIKEYSYIDYLKEYLEEKKDKVTINKDYLEKDNSIKEVLSKLKDTPNLKRVLYDTNLLVISLGYNDYLYSLSLEEEITNSKLNQILLEIDNNYNELIDEIRKYYHNKIVVVGTLPKTNTIKEIGTKEINKILKNNPEIIYIDTEELLKNRKNTSQTLKVFIQIMMDILSYQKKLLKKHLNTKKIFDILITHLNYYDE